MIPLRQICEFLEDFAPRGLAEDWDNVGLLVGDSSARVSKVLTCLTVTPASAEEAVTAGVQLIVTHHPLPFQALKRITTETTTGQLLLRLIQAGIAVYSPHTAFDSARSGINQRWAERLGLTEVQPLLPAAGLEGLGAGRWGRWTTPRTVADVAATIKESLAIPQVGVVGPAERKLERAAIACGSAGQFMTPARRAGCQLLITGETNFHTCLEAEATGTALILTGHFASERFAVEELAEVLRGQFADLTIWPSRQERDPLVWR